MKTHRDPARAATNLKALQRVHQKNHTGYRFKDKDPIIGLLQAAYEQSGLSLKDLATASTMSVGSLGGWFSGDVRRPQHASVKFVARALNLDLALYNSQTRETFVYDAPRVLHPPKKVKRAKPRAKAKPKRSSGRGVSAHT
jgi:transcriptional regulator with XRE-family HTH domain